MDLQCFRTDGTTLWCNGAYPHRHRLHTCCCCFRRVLSNGKSFSSPPTSMKTAQETRRAPFLNRTRRMGACRRSRSVVFYHMKTEPHSII